MLRAMVAYMSACRDAYAAAAIYEQLSRLSDAELSRRGMTRDDLRYQLVDRLTSGF
jgi:hypothetical protein